MHNNIAGTVILYNPDANALENLKSYSSTIAKLFVVDNSESASDTLNKEILLNFDNIEYIPLGQNLGIAKALNVAAEKALEEGFEWLLTMDQDSKASDDMLEKLLKAFNRVPSEQVGILAPRYVLASEPNKRKRSGLEEVYVAITSGSLLNLRAFKKVGPFREDFFIDYVDHEYCLRLRSNNYKILIDNDVVLYHELGNSRNHSIFGYTINSSHHNFIRRYYITRNRLAVIQTYKHLFPYYYKCERTNNLREFLKIIFFEEDKFKKVRSMMYGYLDFQKNKLGKYRY